MNCSNCQNPIADGEKFCGKCGQLVQYVQQPNQAVVLKYAGFWIRFVAAVVDGVILWTVFTIFYAILLALGVFAPTSGVFVITSWIKLILFFVAPFLYFIIMTSRYQATLGKMVVGVRVVAENGEKASSSSILLRETIGKIASGAILFGGFVIAGFTEKKQALHDMLMNKTVVVYNEPKKSGTFIFSIVVGICLVSLAVIFGLRFLLSSSPVNKASDANMQRTTSNVRDISIKAAISSEAPAAIAYYKKNSSFVGFQTEMKLPDCSGVPIVNISQDGQRIAIFGKFCSNGEKYFCAERNSDLSYVPVAKEVSRKIAISGSLSCE